MAKVDQQGEDGLHGRAHHTKSKTKERGHHKHEYEGV